MSRWKAVSPWVETVSMHLPMLSPPQARVLALWSYGVALTQCAGTTSVAAFLAALLGQNENTWRQRLREWYWEAGHKRGRGRRTVEVTPCFAGLLRWVLAWWPAEERRLALALDATTLGERFTVLSASVVYRSCAIPVAWAVTRANTPGAWQPHWTRLLQHLHGAVPADWTVLVLADRGLYARWLFVAIQQAGWHPFLRVNAGGRFRPVVGGAPSGAWCPLSVVAPTVGRHWAGEALCFITPACRLRCTLLACWEAGHQDRWLVVTDLPPQTAQVAWYRLRGWIEQGFKDLKRGGWGWHQTKMRDPARAERYWLVLAVATLWMVSLGGLAEDNLPMSSLDVRDALPPTHIARRTCRGPSAAPVAVARRLSLFRRGRLVALAEAVSGHVRSVGFFARSPWPHERAPGVQYRPELSVLTC